jgi:hypothetical protein
MTCCAHTSSGPAIEHKGQSRRSGEPYLVHPLEVADILADLRLDVVSVASGLLHDIVEDTPNSIEKVRELFGEQVAHVVEGVTKLSSLQFASSEERQAELQDVPRDGGRYPRDSREAGGSARCVAPPAQERAAARAGTRDITPRLRTSSGWQVGTAGLAFRLDVAACQALRVRSSEAQGRRGLIEDLRKPQANCRKRRFPSCHRGRIKRCGRCT